MKRNLPGSNFNEKREIPKHEYSARSVDYTDMLKLDVPAMNTLVRDLDDEAIDEFVMAIIKHADIREKHRTIHVDLLIEGSADVRELAAADAVAVEALESTDGADGPSNKASLALVQQAVSNAMMSRLTGTKRFQGATKLLASTMGLPRKPNSFSSKSLLAAARRASTSSDEPQSGGSGGSNAVVPLPIAFASPIESKAGEQGQQQEEDQKTGAEATAVQPVGSSDQPGSRGGDDNTSGVRLAPLERPARTGNGGAEE